jgi:hypothetical protein
MLHAPWRQLLVTQRNLAAQKLVTSSISLNLWRLMQNFQYYRALASKNMHLGDNIN